MRKQKNRGPFITFEGIDGSGKSSQVGSLKQLLTSRGYDVVTTKEPGGTPLGDRLRHEFKYTAMDLKTEVLLAFASRAEHISKIILPALKEGRAVISDRFSDSTFAYQGGASGFKWSYLDQLETMVLEGLEPDLTLMCCLPIDEAERRRCKRANTQSASVDGVEDKFDSLDNEKFKKIVGAYDYRMKTAKVDRFRSIDTSGTFEDVSAKMSVVVSEFLDAFEHKKAPNKSSKSRKRQESTPPRP